MKREKILKLIRIALLIVIAICLVRIGQAYSLSAKNDAQQKELKRLLRQNDSQNLPSSETRDDNPPKERETFAELLAINGDLAGWLFIDGTSIDYPVMQNADDNYYLTHDFYGKENKHGCLFVKAAADIETPGTNFIIYGHNMKDGSMFGELDFYKKQAFCKEHSLISFETPAETRMYEVMAVFQDDLTDNDGFSYYQFYQADNEAEFLDFYENVKKRSLYDTKVTAAWGDTFLTLSTCDYHTKNGRFVVVAKQKKNAK